DRGVFRSFTGEDGDHPLEAYMNTTNQQTQPEHCIPLLSGSLPGAIDFAFGLPKNSKLR
ncbi:jg25020, partial [Pararge aegeria aegeria]